MTANWANTKITCDVKSTCAYHYTKTHDVLEKGPVKLSCLLMKITVLFQTSSTVSDLIEQVLTKHHA